MRIYELAKELNVTSQDVKDALDKLKITYKTHSSAIPDESLETIKKMLVPAKAVTQSSKKDKKSSDSVTEKPEPVKAESKAKSSKSAAKKKAEPKKVVSEAADREGKESVKTTAEKKTAEPSLLASSANDESGTSPETVNSDLNGDSEAEGSSTSLVVDADDASLSKEVNEVLEDYEDYYSTIKMEEEERLVKKKASKSHGQKSTKKEDVDADKANVDGFQDSGLALHFDAPVVVSPDASVKEFSETTGIPVGEVIKKLFLLGVTASINQNLDKDTILILADEFKIPLKMEEPALVKADQEEEFQFVEAEADTLEPRAPVVTIMGHVDHGKTTLLDTLRKSRVAESESGGITQHIGAYVVTHNDFKITFIDTPGHQAFSSMRQMGANITDIVVIVVSAVDGIKPQTREAINHAKEAEVPLIVAINKIDVDGANPDKIKSEFAEIGLTPEEWGGETLFVQISALKNLGLDDLLEAIKLQTEILELKANSKGKAFGIVLESCNTDKMGALVTVLVKNGTFKTGMPLVCGHVHGKVRRMEDDQGQVIREAYPSTPVRIFGFSDVPEVGARVKVLTSEKEAREIASEEASKLRKVTLNKKEKVTLENIYSSIHSELKKDYKAVLKTDVVGSLRAISGMLESIPSEKVVLKIIHSATGPVTENDIMMAHANKAMVFAFRAKVTNQAISCAKQYGVKIKEYDIIYRLYEDVQRAMEGLLDKEYSENALGVCQVKKVFKIGKQGSIAGCLVTDGKVLKDAYCRIRRNGELLDYKGKIASLKHYKDEVKEVKMGTECGVALRDFDAFEEGDQLEFYTLLEVATVL